MQTAIPSAGTPTLPLKHAHARAEPPRTWCSPASSAAATLLYTVYDVPSIAICRADQRFAALQRLNLPTTAWEDVREHGPVVPVPVVTTPPHEAKRVRGSKSRSPEKQHSVATNGSGRDKRVRDDSLPTPLPAQVLPPPAATAASAAGGAGPSGSQREESGGLGGGDQAEGEPRSMIDMWGTIANNMHHHAGASLGERIVYCT